MKLTNSRLFEYFQQSKRQVMSNNYGSNETRGFYHDELVETYNATVGNSTQMHTAPLEDANKLRQVRLILDHTAFVRGIGNVKRWFHEEYISQNFNKSADPIKLNIYIPSYTLHEFDYVKRGTSISATNAREAIKFIDNYLENNLFDQKTRENQNGTNPGLQRILYNVNLESPIDATPSWNNCAKYKLYSPLIKDFPNMKTDFNANAVGNSPAQSADDHDLANHGDYSSDFNASFAIDYDSLAEMPSRLKYLIRTCIYKRYIERYIPTPKNSIEEWKLVTEDPITKIWAKAYGIDCVNVNEAELLIFQNYDVNLFRIYNPFSSSEDEFDPKNNILQNKIDTTLYSYQSIKQDPPKVNFKGRSRRNKNSNNNNNNNNNNENSNNNITNKNKNKNKNNKQKQKQKQSKEDDKTICANIKESKEKSQKKKRIPVDGVVHEEINDNTGYGLVKKEKFKAINYAPRGSGELWKP